MDDLCTVCGKKVVIRPSYSGYGYCEADFRVLLEKRIRKDLRTNQPIDVKKEYVFLDDGSPLADLTRSFLKSIFGDFLRLKSVASANITSLTIVPSCLEMDASSLFERFLDQKPPSLAGIRPLRLLMLEDINHLLKNKIVHVPVHELLSAMEKEQHGSFFGLIKLFEK